MGLISTSLLYLRRKFIQTMILVLMVGLIVLGEVIGILLYVTSVQAEIDAYNYIGAALLFDDWNLSWSLDLSQEDYDAIRQLDHVIGLYNWREIVVTPVGTENVKIHTGVDPSTQEVTEEPLYSGDDMTIVAETDIWLDDDFRWESSVSVIAGEYPDSENGGIMVESRYAETNNLEVGDTVSFYSETYDAEAELVICGIYKVDSDFEILSSNGYGTAVYIYSPYNVIYMEYFTAIEVFGVSTTENGCGIYVDDLDNIDEVSEELREMFGEDINIYDNTDSYLNDECKIVRLMRKMALVIMVTIFVLGSVLLLLALSMFASQFQEEAGRFLVLGRSRRWCVCRFGFITLCYIVAGLALGMLVYALVGDALSNVIWDVSSDVISNSVGRAAGVYETPNYRQGFAVTVDMAAVYAPVYLAALAGAMAVVWAVTLVIPLRSVLRSRARTLLQDAR